MILSVSRRTDIPAFYSDWFFNRIKEGFVCVRNPMNYHQVSKIQINPQVVDCFVFWTKNPKPMLARLDEIKDYRYYFQYTINSYDTGLERRVPCKESLIETFIQLSEKIGSNRVIWRYDPILLSDSIDFEYHIKYFEEIAKRLHTYTKRCVISFMDEYSKTKRNLRGTTARGLTDDEIFTLAKAFVPIAQKYGMEIQTCSEKIDLHNLGIEHGKCIDNEIVAELLGFKIDIPRDKNQRKECGCVQSIDIGEYNTCLHNCLYCYATFSTGMVDKKRKMHDPSSPLLIGHIEPADKVTVRAICSLKKS